MILGEKKLQRRKATSHANIVFKRKSAYLDAKVSRFFFLLQGISAHTNNLYMCVPTSLYYIWYNTFTQHWSMLMNWTDIVIHCRIASFKTMSRKWHTCVTLCLFVFVLLFLDLNMISYDFLLSLSHFGYSLIRFRV